MGKEPVEKSSQRNSVWLNAALAIMGLLVLVLVYSLVTRAFAPRVDPGREANPGSLVGDIIQVEVRNGSGVDGLAGRTTDFLRDRGFDVVEVGNHESFDVPHSMVVDRVGDVDAARKVARSLGIADERVRQEIRPELYLDASIVIGKDYATLAPFGGE